MNWCQAWPRRLAPASRRASSAGRGKKHAQIFSWRAARLFVLRRYAARGGPTNAGSSRLADVRSYLPRALFSEVSRALEFLGPEMIPGHLGAVVMSMSARLTNCTIALRAAAELRSSIALKTRR